MIDPAIVDRLREAAAGFPNPIVNDTAIVRRADLHEVLHALAATPDADGVEHLRTLLRHAYEHNYAAYRERDAALARDQILRELLDAYRRKRAVDGLNARDWDGAVHWKAEQDIEQLERRYAALHPERHLADAETPP